MAKATTDKSSISSKNPQRQNQRKSRYVHVTARDARGDAACKLGIVAQINKALCGILGDNTVNQPSAVASFDRHMARPAPFECHQRWQRSACLKDITTTPLSAYRLGSHSTSDLRAIRLVGADTLRDPEILHREGAEHNDWRATQVNAKQMTNIMGTMEQTTTLPAQAADGDHPSDIGTIEKSEWTGLGYVHSALVQWLLHLGEALRSPDIKEPLTTIWETHARARALPPHTLDGDDGDRYCDGGHSVAVGAAAAAPCVPTVTTSGLPANAVLCGTPDDDEDTGCDEGHSALVSVPRAPPTTATKRTATPLQPLQTVWPNDEGL
ncbi:hypothetical protein EDB83DRAFT_2313223 [Lactarius deliciosus]|nr:hypothetical protein EDB83DRAFT_2313223 [Lactarius deliciosus]